MNHKDFFTIYNAVEPPASFREAFNIPEIGSTLYSPELISTTYKDDILSDYSLSSTSTKNDSEFRFEYPSITSNLEQPQQTKQESNNKVTLKGSSLFELALLKAIEINPEISQYRNFLIKTAKLESGFNSRILNRAGAPYYGYFLMGRREIQNSTGLTVEQFRNDPVLQILGAVKLYKSNLKTIKALGVYDLCKLKGFTDDAIVAGAWLGGPGGVKKFIKGLGNPSDSHWYGGKGGTSVGERMKEFNSYT